MRDEDGRDYVIALPIQKRAYHKDIVNFCRKLYGKELELARRSHKIYLKRTDIEKRMILKTMFKKIEITDGKVTYELIEPVRMLQERLNSLIDNFEPKNPYKKSFQGHYSLKLLLCSPSRIHCTALFQYSSARLKYMLPA